MPNKKSIASSCLVSWILLSVVFASCDENTTDKNLPDGSVDGDTDGDTDTDSDADTDGDTDTDSDADSGTNDDAGKDTESDDNWEMKYKVRLQPIQVALDDGTDPANPDRLRQEDAVAKIWAQMGIKVEWLPWVVWNNTAVHDCVYDVGPDNATIGAPLHEDSNVINVLFVKKVNQQGTIGGLSKTPGNIIYMSEWVFTRDNVPVHVVAHEIGHSFGLDHEDFGSTEDIYGNLMYGDAPLSIDNIFPDGEQMSHLTDQQIERVLQSSLVEDLYSKRRFMQNIVAIDDYVWSAAIL